MIFAHKLVVFSGFDDGVNAFQFVAAGLLLCGRWSLTGLTSLISRSVEIGVFFVRLLLRRSLDAMKLCRCRIRKKMWS